MHDWCCSSPRDNIMKRRLGTTFAVVAMLLTLGACSSSPIVPPPGADIPEFISNASTAADHQRLAGLFSRRASSYEADAKQHERMAVAYAGHPKGDAGIWAAHCSALRVKPTEAAREARTLEKAHRDLAERLSR